MPKVTYLQHDGTRHDIEVPVGTSVMRGAVDNGIAGIDGDCGGVCACGTCHVYVPQDWFERLPTAQSREQDMLGFAAEVQANSRLACQIEMTAALDGLVVQLPQSQH
jgi:2Fe-2S ferredoxin